MGLLGLTTLEKFSTKISLVFQISVSR